MCREISFVKKSSHLCANKPYRKTIAKGITVQKCCAKGFWDSKKKQCKVPSMIQSISFNSDIFDLESAKDWLRKNLLF